MHSDNVVGLTKKKPAASPRGRVSARSLRMSRNGRSPRRGSHHSWLDEQQDEQDPGEESEEKFDEDIEDSEPSAKATRFSQIVRQETASKSSNLRTGKKRKQRGTGMRRGVTRTFDDESGKNSSVIPLEGRSLFLFRADNPVRQFCAATVSHRYFDPFVLTMICVSTMMLTLENPLNDPDGGLMEFLKYMDYVFTTIFVVECVLKNVQSGFLFNGSHSYIRSAWNMIDFLIVAFSLISVFSLGVDPEQRLVFTDRVRL